VGASLVAEIADQIQDWKLALGAAGPGGTDLRLQMAGQF
jgi:hypothetical protein